MRRIRSCRARAASGHAAAALPRSVMNSRRFMSDMGFLPPPPDLAPPANRAAGPCSQSAACSPRSDRHVLGADLNRGGQPLVVIAALAKGAARGGLQRGMLLSPAGDKNRSCHFQEQMPCMDVGNVAGVSWERLIYSSPSGGFLARRQPTFIAPA